MDLMRDGRGQAFSGELMLGFTIFLVSLILTLGLWNSQIKGILVFENRVTMDEAAIDAAEKLIRTPGVPQDWDEGNITSFGLANESRYLLPEKINSFTHLLDDGQNDLCISGDSNYECNLYKLGLAGYNFYFNLTYLNGSTVEVGANPAFAGRAPSGETELVTITRTGIYDEKLTRAIVTVWK